MSTVTPKKIDGKEIILQRLRSSTIDRSLKFIQGEQSGRLMDVNSPLVIPFRKGGSRYDFDFSKVDAKYLSNVNKNLRPFFFGEQKWEEMQAMSPEARAAEINDVVARSQKSFENKIDDALNGFASLKEKQQEFLIEKSINTLFLIDYIVTGLTTKGDMIRFPLYLKLVDVEASVQGKKAKVITTGEEELLANAPIVSFFGNREGLNVEKIMANFEVEAENKSKIIQTLLKLYEEVGIKIRYDEFLRAQKAPEEQLKELNEVERTPEAKERVRLIASRTVVALANDFFDTWIDLVDDDNQFTLDCLNWIDIKFDKYIQVMVAGQKRENLDKACKKTSEKLNEELEVLRKILYSKFAGKEDKIETYVQKQQTFADEVLKRLSNKVPHFIDCFTIKDIMSRDELRQQWQSDALLPEIQTLKDQVEMKPGEFVISKVNLLGTFPSMISPRIYKDVSEIFKKTTFVEKRLKDLNRVTEGMNSLEGATAFGEEKVKWGFRSDVYQQEAVFVASLGFDVIIQGPPGTGKTQTILNVISNGVNSGKRILIVSEKKTALEVIYDRIRKEQPDFGKIVLDLYNISTTKPDFFLTLPKIMDIANGTFRGNEAFFKSHTDEVKVILGLTKFYDEIKKVSWEKVSKIKFDQKEKDFIAELPKDKMDKLVSFTKQRLISISEWYTERETIEKWIANLPFKIDKYNLPRLIEFAKGYVESTWKRQMTETSGRKGPFTRLWSWQKEEVPISKASAEIKAEFDILLRDQRNMDWLIRINNFDYNKFTKEELESYAEVNSYGFKIGRLISIIEALRYKFAVIEAGEAFKNPVIFADHQLDDKEFTLSIENILKKVQPQIKNVLKDPATLQMFDVELRKKGFKPFMKSFIFDWWDKVSGLFPVVLATPEQVSEFIPLKRELFDMTILDEASQMFTEKAIPTLFRSKQFCVSGDKMQLRPQKSGARIAIDYDPEVDEISCREIVEWESLLDYFDYMIQNESQKVMLQTHYRSSVNELINYSNMNFYGGNLKFVDKFGISDKRIEVVDVEGKWERQRNVVECEKIVDIINEYYSRDAKASVGVITFNEGQAKLIRRSVLKRGHPDAVASVESLEPGTLFIKTANDVQGDERDVIIFSIGYGKDQSKYGYLNLPHGENRMNVIASRSKEKMIIVKSHKASEYKMPSTPVSGVTAFQDFLKYVESVVGMNLSAADVVQELKVLRAKFGSGELKRNGDFSYLVKDGEAHFVVENDYISEPRKKFWFYQDLLRARGYKPVPHTMDEFYGLVEN